MKLSELRPGWRTDFILHRQDAVINALDDCISVRTPANPGFYWGNFLLLPQGPRDDELAHWLARFETEITRIEPACTHVAIGINAAPTGEPLPGWVAAGFEAIESAVIELLPGELRAPAKAPRGEVQVRPLDLAHELEAAVALQCTDAHGFEPVAYAEHRRQQMLRIERMAAQGLAQWFGVWCDGVLAADCGLIRDSATPGATARFQRVMTHPAWRRRGLCSTLVHAVTAWGAEHWRPARFIMCADPDDVAIGIYESLGYRRIDREWCLQRKAPRDMAAA